MISFLTYFILFVVHCLSIDGPLFANNQLLNHVVELNMNSKDTITLKCRFNGKIQWNLPNNTEYKDYSNPMDDGRYNIETLGNQSILTINDLRYTDTGLYKCVSRKDSNEDNESSSSTRIEIGAYVFVKDDNPNHLFMHFISNTITVYKDRDSYLNCKITDPNAKVDLLIGGEVKTDFEYDKQKGFRVPAGSLEHLRSPHEMECVATNPSTNTRDSTSMLLLMIERKPNTLIGNISPDNADKLFYLNNRLNLHCNVANYNLQECTWSYPPASNILINKTTHSIFLDSVNWSNNGTYKCTCKNMAYPDQISSTEIHGIVRRTKNLIKIVNSGHSIKMFNGVQCPKCPVATFYANVDIFVPETIMKEEISVQWFHKQSNVQYGSTTVPVDLNSIGIDLLDEVDQAVRSADLGQGLSFANKQIKLRMENVKLRQSGEYSLVVEAGDAEMNITFPLLVNATASVEFFVSDTISLTKRLNLNFLEKDKPYKVWCIAEGIPLKKPHLVFCPCVLEQGEQCSESCMELEEGSRMAQIEMKIGTYQWAIIASLNATTSSTFKCKVDAATAQHIPFVVTDIVDSQKHSGFSAELARSDFEHQGPDDVYLHDSAVLSGKIQKYIDKKGGVQWYFKPNSTSSWVLLKEDGIEKRQSTNYSHVYQLTLNDIQLNQSGIYKCVRNSDKVSRERNLKVRISTKPSERNTTIDRDLYFRYTTTNALIKCDAQGVPFPKITWSKDGVPLSERYELSEKNTKITIGTIVAEDEGKYICTMKNPAGKSTAEFRVHVTGLSPLHITLLSTGLGILAIIVVALFIVLCFVYSPVVVMRCNYKKQVSGLFNYQLYDNKDADVEDKVNLLIPINEQPENLTFKREFDMPKNSLNMDLAQEIARWGAFGVVYMVPLKVANNPIVIAKIVKRISFELHDQLISEVKIMIYVGDHVNVLSLIGAVTTQLAKGILLIVTEYCEKGSLLKLMQRMRERFNYENTPESRRDQSRSAARPMNANGFWIPQSFNANRHRFHTVEHDFDEELCSADLLCFLYQIANGMVFLSSRKIIHRDLAARNIFITRNNLVRIADYGLPREGETYHTKKSMKMSLPIAQLAPEALLYNQFSEKSDVWSFGILMFEIFSLGEKPYPTRDFNQQFLDDLKNGLHPNNPQYSSIEMNQLMEKCWELKVSNRPDHEECRSYIQDQLESHCSVCYNNLNIALKDDANKPDFSHLREEFGRNQSFGYEVPKSAMKCVKEKENRYIVAKNFNIESKKDDPASKCLINQV